MFRVPILVRGVRVSPFLCCWISPLLGSLFVVWFGGPRFLRKLDFSSSKFCWVRFNTVDKEEVYSCWAFLLLAL